MLSHVLAQDNPKLVSLPRQRANFHVTITDTWQPADPAANSLGCERESNTGPPACRPGRFTTRPPRALLAKVEVWFELYFIATHSTMLAMRILFCTLFRYEKYHKIPPKLLKDSYKYT